LSRYRFFPANCCRDVKGLVYETDRIIRTHKSMLQRSSHVLTPAIYAAAFWRRADGDPFL
jgi:hypothetical protein